MGAALIGTARELREGQSPAASADVAAAPDTDAPVGSPTWRLVAEQLLWPTSLEASDGGVEDGVVGDFNLSDEGGALAPAPSSRAATLDAFRLFVILCAAGLLLVATLALNSLL
jgi:hypothetical protein